ncbi:MAG: TldD/PmbA family protein [Fimbriimonadaceae bacterium]|nr:TldD/PmbA family protein [Fimbriimonadaceae bacterium]
MHLLCREGLAAALAAGAGYADARGLLTRWEYLGAKHGRPSDVTQTEDLGISLRVLVDGAWGFAATARPTREAVLATAQRAVANAREAARFRRQPVQLAPEPVVTARYETPRQQDPWTVSLSSKLDLLVRVSELLEQEPAVRVGEARMGFRTEEQVFLTSEGSVIDQTLHWAGCGIAATTTGPGGIQRRSYPSSWLQWISGGYELLDRYDLLSHAAQCAAEAAALQQADPCPAGEFDLILDPQQLTLQIHESVGHPLELDRVLGGEANYAGTSFATPDLCGSLQYGSPLVTLTADATLPEGVATFGFDDEGVAAQKWSLVEDGVLRSYLTSREYAGVVGEQRSRGTMRADGWRHVPIVRMVNISLEPGREPLSLEELIADTKHGLLMSTNRSWSIDQRRVNFQFGCELAYEIRHGKLGRLLRNPTYQGYTTGFWNRCDAICDAREWSHWGIFNCGKGQPPQTAEMSHGSSPARFRQVNCGVS